jgi:hypothetical protein
MSLRNHGSAFQLKIYMIDTIINVLSMLDQIKIRINNLTTFYIMINPLTHNYFVHGLTEMRKI